MNNVFNLNDIPWVKNTHQSVGKVKQILGTEYTSQGELRILQLEAEEKFNSHEHNFLQVMYFVKGTGILTIDDNSHDIVPGLVAIVLPQQCHSVSNTDEIPMELVVFEAYNTKESNTPFVDF